jgi:hypothetical protein
MTKRNVQEPTKAKMKRYRDENKNKVREIGLQIK